MKRKEVLYILSYSKIQHNLMNFELKLYEKFMRSNLKEFIIFKNKVLAVKKIGYLINENSMGHYTVESMLSSDTYSADPQKGKKGEYYKIGKKNISKVAILFLCSGEGTRVITGNKKRKPILEGSYFRETPLMGLFRSTPVDVPKILISVQQKDTIIKDYLKLHNNFGRSEENLLFIDQPEVETDSEKIKTYPGGGGLVVREVLHNPELRKKLGTSVKHIIIMDGEKMKYDREELYQFIGFHIKHENQLTVATYPVMPDPVKKFAHIDSLNNRAFTGAKTPGDLIVQKEHHHLNGGVYMVSLADANCFDNFESFPDHKTKDNETFNFMETPTLTLINSKLMMVGYWQHERGKLGKGIKDRKSITANVLADSEQSINVLQKIGWTVFPCIVELLDVKINNFQPNNRVSAYSTVFFAGNTEIGEENTFSNTVKLSPGENEIIVDNNNNLSDFTGAGKVIIGDKNKIQQSVFVADDPNQYSNYIPDLGTFAVRDLINLEKRIGNVQNFETNNNKHIIVGNNNDIRNTQIFGKVILGDNVILNDVTIINTSDEALIIPPGSKLINVYWKDSQIKTPNNRSIFVARSTLIGESLASGAGPVFNYDSTIKNDDEILVYYIDKFMRDSVNITNNMPLDKKILAVMNQLCGKDVVNLSHKLTNDNRPGLFLIKDSGKDYEEIKNHLHTHMQYLLKFAKNINPNSLVKYDLADEQIQEIRECMTSFLNLSINKPALGTRFVDLLTIQEAKKVLNDILREAIYTYTQGKIKDPFETLKGYYHYSFSKLLAKLEHSTELIKNSPTLKDWLKLAVMANYYDFATGQIRDIFCLGLERREHNDKDVANMIIKGWLPIFILDNKNRDLFEVLLKNEDIRKVSGEDEYFEFNFETVNDNKYLSNTYGAYTNFLKELITVSRNNFEIISKDFEIEKACNELINELLQKDRITFMFSNSGSILLETKFIEKLIELKKEANMPMTNIDIILNKKPVENDTYVNDSSWYAAKAGFLLDNYITIRTDHNSSLLGRDISQYSQQLVEDLKKSLVVSFGLGGFITMQNAPFDSWHLFLSKGHVGEKVDKLFSINPKKNYPVIVRWQAGKDIRQEYQAKFLK